MKEGIIRIAFNINGKLIELGMDWKEQTTICCLDAATLAKISRLLDTVVPKITNDIDQYLSVVRQYENTPLHCVTAQ